MTRRMLKLTDESFELMSTMALVYVIEQWDEFIITMNLENGPEGPYAIPHMFDEIAHYTSAMLLNNEDVLKVLFVQWGEEKVDAFIKKLTNHERN